MTLRMSALAAALALTGTAFAQTTTPSSNSTAPTPSHPGTGSNDAATAGTPAKRAPHSDPLSVAPGTPNNDLGSVPNRPNPP